MAGSTKASSFGANPRAASEVSRELSRIRSEMGTLAKGRGDLKGVTGSKSVEEALDRFFSESSDNRKAMDELLKGASSLLRALADGTTSVDQALAGALQPKTSPGPSRKPPVH